MICCPCEPKCRNWALCCKWGENMPGKGKFSGFYWHNEFHTVDPKKEKAADCIYLTTERICRNKQCFLYGEKCFVATHCRFRKKGQGKEQTTSEEKVWKCSLPVNCVIYSKTHGIGHYIGCDDKNKLITVKYDACTRSYLYPNAFLEHHLYGNQTVTDCVMADSAV